MRNPDFEAALKEMLKTHEMKNEDYSDGDNPYSNFEYAGAVAAPFTDPVDRAFMVLIANKLARIAELRKPGRKPKNEATIDSFKDLATYAAIWYARAKRDLHR